MTLGLLSLRLLLAEELLWGKVAQGLVRTHCVIGKLPKAELLVQGSDLQGKVIDLIVWCIRSSVVNKWVLYANPFLRFEQESGFLSFRKPSNNVVNYGYRTIEEPDAPIDVKECCGIGLSSVGRRRPRERHSV